MIAILKGDNVYEVKEIVIEGVSSVKTLNDAGANVIDKFKGNDNSSEK